MIVVELLLAAALFYSGRGLLSFAVELWNEGHK